MRPVFPISNLAVTVQEFYVIGTNLGHVRFADDSVLIAKSLEELNELLTDLSRQSLPAGLSINPQKTTILSEINGQKEI